MTVQLVTLFLTCTTASSVIPFSFGGRIPLDLSTSFHSVSALGSSMMMMMNIIGTAYFPLMTLCLKIEMEGYIKAVSSLHSEHIITDNSISPTCH